jgi:hypothetical protein
MADNAEYKPSHDYVIPTEHVDEVKKIVREKIPECIIGTKDLGEGKTFFTVTVFSRTPQALAEVDELVSRFQDTAELSGERPKQTSMADLIERVKQAQQGS